MYVGHASIIGNMSEQPDFGHIPQLTLGWRIQMALAEAGLKHQDLMDKFEVSRATVSKWCRDVGAPPKKFVVNEIAVMCGVPARWLIDGTVDGHDDGPDGSPKTLRRWLPVPVPR